MLPPLYAGPPADAIEERRVRRLAAARHAPASWLECARIIALSWDGAQVGQIASELGCHPRTVYRWLHRFNASGIDGLGDLPRSGRPRRLGSCSAVGSSPWPEATRPAGLSASPMGVSALTGPRMPTSRRSGPWTPWPLPPRPRASASAAARSAASTAPLASCTPPASPRRPRRALVGPATAAGPTAQRRGPARRARLPPHLRDLAGGRRHPRRVIDEVMGHEATRRAGQQRGSAIGAHYRHTTAETAARTAAAVQQHLTVVLQVAEARTSRTTRLVL
jgi:hypothetical protein